MFKYIKVMLSVLLLCLIPGSSNAWFFPPDGQEHPGFTTKASIPGISVNSYVLHYNTPNDCQCFAIFPNSGNNTAVLADCINIDIPLIILGNEMIDPEESLDRTLAANLRIQDILDEYLAFNKRAELLLKNLRIPYLEKRGTIFRPKSAIAGWEGETLKKDIRNIIRHGTGYNWTHFEQVELSVAAIHKPSQTGTGLKMHLNQGDNGTINQTTYSMGHQKFSTENVGNQYDNELPWIFRFIFRVLTYANTNKLEIVLWSATMLISILIVTLVAKR